MKTGLPATGEEIAARIADCCKMAARQAKCDMAEVSSVGIGTPGIANSDTGEVEYSCNLGFRNTPLADLVSRQLEKPVYLENDANAAALGEFTAGCGRDSHSLIAITLGTGVGGGVVMNDKLLTGFNFAGAEIGHFVMVHNGEPCSCGRKGCFEAYCSATALIRQTRRAMEQHPESKMWEIAPTPEQVDGKTAFNAMELGRSRGKAGSGAVLRLSCLRAYVHREYLPARDIVRGRRCLQSGRNAIKACARDFLTGRTMPEIVSAAPGSSGQSWAMMRA